MDKIKAKQIEGVVDLNSNQSISGVKSYSAPQHFVGGELTMVAYQDAMYWCQNPNELNEPGNSRLRMQEGMLYLETFNGSDWVMG